MAYIIACLMAALSFLVNKTLVKYIGPPVVLTWGPVVEELAKTLLAWYLGADVLLTHIAFGVIEGGYDWLTGGRRSAQAALSSLAGHTLFGSITIGLLSLTGTVWLALAGAIVAHAAWNTAVIHLQR